MLFNTVFINLEQVVHSRSFFAVYLEIVLSIKSTNQKHGGFDVTVSLFSCGPSTDHGSCLSFYHLSTWSVVLCMKITDENKEIVTSK